MNTIAIPPVESAHTPVPALEPQAQPAPTAAPIPGLILAAFSPATRRQLELTVNALSRSVRKAIRHAERLERDNAPTAETAAAWQHVEQRHCTLCAFVRSLVIEPLALPVPAQTEPAPVDPEQLRDCANETKTAPEDEVEVDEQKTEAYANPNLERHLNEMRRFTALPDDSRQQRRYKLRQFHKLITRLDRENPPLAAMLRKSIQEGKDDEP